eukprot:CAMPEP_0170513950 /NCGR_PEP_ID=MMETSP0209-20121228/524_1 /TAXON_ID=665100 ORGANISM="Litonotus pictus, Strain P1" /NCGR_SAMPLE_ID=MMETSP0209 /ASSEMBLY_ACC=CAM_ASM_000301 /LENGTH=637 /DNA_ID=CAMNT_0010797821 /DNA_START=33 /DNA_END=1946 /DNA_ORIENTATION=-
MAKNKQVTKPKNKQRLKLGTQRSSKAVGKKATMTTKIMNKTINANFKAKKQEKQQSNNNDLTTLFTQNIQNLTTKNKAKVIHKLIDLIISYPEENIDKLGHIFELLEDNNIKIVDYCFKAIAKVLYDIMPTYNIYTNRHQEKGLERGKNVSKFQQSLQNFEIKVVDYYSRLITSGEVFLKASPSSTNPSGAQLQEMKDLKLTIVKKLGKLFKKYYNISLENNNSLMAGVLTKQLLNEIPEVRKEALQIMAEVLRSIDNIQSVFELKLKMLNQISFIIYNNSNSNKLDTEVIVLLDSHKVEFPDYDPNKKMGKIEKQVMREVNEYEEKNSPEVVYRNNLKILKVILALYFEFIKNRGESRFIPLILKNISNQIHYINVEILADLQACINKLIKSYLERLIKKEGDKKGKEKGKNKGKGIGKNISISTEKGGISKENTQEGALPQDLDFQVYRLCMSAFRTNIKIKEAISKDEVLFEEKDIINNLYFLIGRLREFVDSLSKDELLELMEMVTLFVITNRQFNMDIVLSFTMRLILLIREMKSEPVVYAFMIMMNRIFTMYPKTRDLLDTSEENYFNDKTNDPIMANGKGANAVKEIIEISNRGVNTKQICENLKKANFSNISNTFKNYYDILLSSKIEN